MLHSGIDLHKRTVVISTVDPDGRPVRDVQLPTKREVITAYFAALPGGPAGQRAAVESTSTWYWLRDLLVGQQVRCKNAISGLLAQYNVTAPSALPPLVQLRVRLLHEQLTLLGDQAKRLAAELNPVLIPTPDVQRLLWMPGVGRVVAFTIWLEVDGIQRFPSARDFVSYCRLVPGAGNSGGKSRHRRTTDGNRYLKLAFSHAAVRAIQYVPEIRAFSRAMSRRKPATVARALVAKELARIVFYVLAKQEAFNGTFQGTPRSRTKQPQWPRLASPTA